MNMQVLYQLGFLSCVIKCCFKSTLQWCNLAEKTWLLCLFLKGLCTLCGCLHQAVSGSAYKKFLSYIIFLLYLLACDVLVNTSSVSLGGLPEKRCVRGHCGPLPEGQHASGRRLQQPRDCYGQTHPEHLRKQITGIYFTFYLCSFI